MSVSNITFCTSTGDKMIDADSKVYGDTPCDCQSADGQRTRAGVERHRIFEEVAGGLAADPRTFTVELRTVVGAAESVGPNVDGLKSGVRTHHRQRDETVGRESHRGYRRRAAGVYASDAAAPLFTYERRVPR